MIPRKPIATAIAALLLLGAGTARSDEPLHIRVGWIIAPSSLAPILFAKPGLAHHQGVSYVLDPVHFDGSTPMITALAAGELDIAELSFSSFSYAIQNGHMDDLRVIADEFQDGADGYRTSQFMVLKDGPVKTIEDLKGKVLATNVIGAGLDIGMRAMLRRHGLEDKRDFTEIEAGYPNMKALLSQRKADLIPAVLPFEVDPELLSIARPLFTQKESLGTTQLLSWGARAGFIEKNRPALVDFMEDVLRALHWYEDPANHGEVIEIVTRFTRQPAALFDGWIFSHGDLYRDPNGLPNLDALQRNVDAMKELGFLTVAIDVRRHADLSITEAAAQRLAR